MPHSFYSKAQNRLQSYYISLKYNPFGKDYFVFSFVKHPV